jgi:hypothetical protein
MSSAEYVIWISQISIIISNALYKFFRDNNIHLFIFEPYTQYGTGIWEYNQYYGIYKNI